ncbi:hypothetical protein ACOBR2_00880 [Telmatobacter bradus]|uniref:hypothetical protein n=1 Tax=Telmatobacter bradus TaxID=474953 RepID=UPI003B431F4D
MSTQYNAIFEVQCRHAYFASGICPALQWIPTSDCQRLLQRYGCLFRNTSGGGVVFRDANSPWQNLSELAPLNFALMDTGGQLTSCTEMGSAPSVAPDLNVYAFSNAADYGTETVDGNALQLLHSSGDAFTGNAIPAHPARFVYPLAQPMTSALVQIVDPLGNEVWKLQTSALAALSLDLRELNEGRYQLKINNADPYDFYLTGTAPAAVWGYVTIYPARLTNTDAGPASFLLSLASRQSYWRYYIVSQSPTDRSYENSSITLAPPKGGKSSGSATVSFSAPTSQSLNGPPAWIFESADPIALYEYPADHYEVTLRNNSQSSGTALPYARANTTRLMKDASGNVRYCSEIFVYL